MTHVKTHHEGCATIERELASAECLDRAVYGPTAAGDCAAMAGVDEAPDAGLDAAGAAQPAPEITSTAIVNRMAKTYA